MKELPFLKHYGPWAVVTGASDGIGREMALCLAEREFNLVLVARNQITLTELSLELKSKYQIETRSLPLDLSRDSGVEIMIAQTRDLDVGLLINAAGFGTSGPFLDAQLYNEIEMLKVNCKAVMKLSYHFGQRFCNQGRGGIIFMSSLLAFQGVPRAAHYSATKAYIQTFAEGLHHELSPFGVDVVSSAPGPVATGFAKRAGMTMSLALKARDVAESTLNALGKRSTIRPGWLSQLLEYSLKPLPRWGRVRMLQHVMKKMTQPQASASISTEGRLESKVVND